MQGHFLELPPARNPRPTLPTEGQSHRSVFQDAEAWGVGAAERGFGIVTEAERCRMYSLGHVVD